MSRPDKKKRVVILVDHRTRDLPVAALIAHHLEARGLDCFLEPIEAYHGVLAAHRPDFILFNHINSSHLVRYSRRLAALNVLTGVLPNEGILYDEDVLRYNSGRFHNGAHIDLFFCWNGKHRDALLAVGGREGTRIVVAGVPRFDFYFPPWSQLCGAGMVRPAGRPRLLVCTNLAFARFAEVPKADVERFFAPWKERLPLYREPEQLVAAHVRYRDKLVKFLNALSEAERFDLTVRPHPREEPGFYQAWLDTLPAGQREHARLDRESNITELILACDAELSCETCTTAMESWIARKPTIELVFERHPLFYHEEISRLNVCCDDPARIVEAVGSQLTSSRDAEFEEGRALHLRTWCAQPDGRSSEAVAEAIAEAVRSKQPTRTTFTLNEQRKGVKLKALGVLGLPYHHDPLLPLKRRFRPQRYRTKSFVLEKSITPVLAAEMRARLAAVARAGVSSTARL